MSVVLEKKVFRVRSVEEIREIEHRSPIFWNEKDMRKYCGMELVMRGPVSDRINGTPCVYWKYHDPESESTWIFPPEWLTEAILPEELFDI